MFITKWDKDKFNSRYLNKDISLSNSKIFKVLKKFINIHFIIYKWK